MYERLRIARTDDVMHVRFNNPRLHNALDGAMLNELVALCRELEGDRQTRFVMHS